LAAGHRRRRRAASSTGVAHSATLDLAERLALLNLEWRLMTRLARAPMDT